MENIVIRRGCKEESARIAELFMLAWPVDEIIQTNGTSYEELHRVVTSVVGMPETIYSFENTFVAEVDGHLAGAMCGYDGADYHRLKQPLVDLLGDDSGFAQLEETQAGEFYLDSVGVLPQYRGRGIASLLFGAQIERAASLGHTRVGLIVDVDKPLAEALYLRLGFAHIGYRDFFGHPMKHMVKEV